MPNPAMHSSLAILLLAGLAAAQRTDETAGASVVDQATAQLPQATPELEAFCVSGIPCPRPTCSPFAYARFIRDPRPYVRAAAALLLRESLGEHKIPKTTLGVLADHPNPEHRRLAHNGSLTRSQFAAAVEQCSAESLLLIIKADLAEIPPHQRRTAANRLYRAALAVRADPRPSPAPGPTVHFVPPGRGPIHVPSPRRANHDRALELFTAAVACDRDALLWIMAMAGNSDRTAIQTRALTAVQKAVSRLPRPSRLPTGLVPLLERLLTSKSPNNRLVAIRTLDRVLDARSISEYRGNLVRTAQSLLADDSVARCLALGQPGVLGCVQPSTPFYRMPRDYRAQIVLTAARLGRAELIAPLLARLRTSKTHLQQMFCVRCLGTLADVTTTDQAIQATKLITSLPANRETQHSLTRLLGKHPERVLPLIASLANSEAEWLWAMLVAQRHVLPRGPLQDLIARHGPTRGRGVTILTAHPEHMQRLFDGDPFDRRVAQTAIDALLQEEHVTTAEIQALPQGLVRDAVARNERTSLPLATIAALRGYLGTAMAAIVGRAHLGKEPAALLRRLGETDDEHGKLAVAKLASRLPGVTTPRPLLEELLQSDDPQICQRAMRLAFREDTAPEHWRDALQHCSKARQAAARTVFGGAELPGDAASLHEAFTSGSTTLYRAALRIVGQLAPSEHLHRQAVVRLTSHPDATVRRAAYAVLATRDRTLWPSAWLAYEAAFDRDRSVRAMAPDAPAAK